MAILLRCSSSDEYLDETQANELNVTYSNLVGSDEFDGSTLDTDKWYY